MGAARMFGYVSSKRLLALTKCLLNVLQMSSMSVTVRSFKLMWEGREILGLPFRDFTAFQNLEGLEDDEAIWVK